MFENYPQYEELFARVQLVFFMLGMGATLSREDFVRIVRQPRHLFAGAVCQFLITPLLAVIVNGWAGLEPGIAVGLILVSAMPGGTLSKVFTYLGKGNIALSITLTLLGTLASMVMVPLLLRQLAFGYVPEDFRIPAGVIVLDLALFLLLPLGVGMSVSSLAPQGRATFSRWCVRCGWVFVFAIIIGSVGSGRIHPTEYGWKVPLAIIAFCLLSMQASMLPFRLRGWPRADCLSVGIEVTMRNLNLAIMLKAVVFPAAVKGVDLIADGVLFVILFYAATAMIAGLLLALNFRRMARGATP